MKKTTHYKGHRWTTDEMRVLMARWEEDVPLLDIAKELNCSDHSVAKKVLQLRKEGIPMKLRHRGHTPGRSNKPWTQPEIEYLWRRRSEKATSEEIAHDLGRTWAAINAMIAKLREEGAPIAMRGNGVRRLWSAEALKAVAFTQRPDDEKIISMDAA